jgi:hypothetical protein
MDANDKNVRSFDGSQGAGICVPLDIRIQNIAPDERFSGNPGFLTDELFEVEEISVVVVNLVDEVLVAPEIAVAIRERGHGHLADSDAGAGCTRHPLEIAVKVVLPSVPCTESSRLRQINDAVTGNMLWIGATKMATLAYVSDINRLAISAQADGNRRTERARCLESLPLIVDDPNRSVNRSLFDRLGARRELADSDLKLPVDNIFGWPFLDIRSSVVKVSNSGRKAEHRQNAGVR